LRAKRDGEVERLQEDAETLRAEARRKGEEERATLVDEARAEARRIAEKAERSVQAELQQARKDAALEIGRLSVELASKVLAREVKPEDHARLAEDFARSLEAEAGAVQRKGKDG
ncbi:MAG: hypothetical protein ACYS9X_30665, partial [Planctomycetota bacterium]